MRPNHAVVIHRRRHRVMFLFRATLIRLNLKDVGESIAKLKTDDSIQKIVLPVTLNQHLRAMFQSCIR